MSPQLFSKMTHALLPRLLDDPSMNTTQVWYDAVDVAVIYAKKSENSCSFSAFLISKETSNSDNSISYSINLPVKSDR